MPRLPSPSHFPASLTLTITPPPSGQQPTNVLILLHGLGDTIASFTTLGKQMSLPETACISIQGPTPLPFDLPGFHWGDDIQFDQMSGRMDFDSGFSKSSKMLAHDVIETALIQKCDYKPREILFFAFGQGGMAALAASALLGSKQELGGVISIGGPLPSSVSPVSPSQPKARTPVLILGGASETLITSSTVEKLKAFFEDVHHHQWKKTGDSMPKNRQEMLPIMQFFARRLRSLKGVPQGSVELS
ncbi:MAG: hypothetical protein M1834_005061 [Cirrosporium novae-zelandiae]|nr:MAG: hypothetical protein M1834_005061 [Cirrosporium novae-zelandiae]